MFWLFACLFLLPTTISHPEYHPSKQYIKFSDYYPKFDWSAVDPADLHFKAVNTSLRDLGKTFNRFIGSQFNVHHLSESQYVSIHERQYSMSTTENSCKWSETEPNRNQYTMSDCLTGQNYANSKAHQSFRGHNLCWGVDNPNWLTNGKFSPQELTQILESHVTHVVSTLKGSGAVYCYDVVNEALNNTGLKPMNPWYPAVQSYFEDAFHTAKSQADTSTLLFYNDYGGEGMNQKSDTIYNFIKEQRAKGLPVDGVGLQMHVSIDYFPPFDQVAQNMKRLGELGVEIHVTEMDVECKPCDKTELAKQAYIYNGMLKACLGAPKCKNFETWGFTDKYTWRNTDEHPLPFDQYYKAKPAFWGLVDALKKQK